MNALAGALSPAATLLSPGGRRGRLSILIYHRVLAAPDPLRRLETVAEDFDWQMRLLAERFVPLPLDQALRRLDDGTLPARAAAVTFDDGYADNYHVALPILRRYRVAATFFIASGYLNGGTMWNDAVIEAVRRLPAGRLRTGELDPTLDVTAAVDDDDSRRTLARTLITALKYLPQERRQRAVERLAARVDAPLPDDLMLTDASLRRLADDPLATIGGHTVSHPILTRLDRQAAADEIAAGKHALEELLQRPLALFAYPNGKPGDDYDAGHVALVRDIGFDAAVSTTRGVSTAASDRWQLPRFKPWDRTPLRFWLRLLQNCRRPR